MGNRNYKKNFGGKSFGNKHDNHQDRNNRPGKDRKFCKICKKSNHNTNECFKSNGALNQNHRVDKNKNKHKPHGKNSAPQQSNREPCTRCGLRGHDRKNCYAKEVPEDEQCECGCEFHRVDQCPWNNDPLEREDAVQHATGKLCQWCKDASDGMHIYDDCKEPKKFRTDLTRNILRAYDALKWCWHCSSVNHTTRGCSASSAEQGKTKWNTKISDIISQWLSYDNAEFEARYMDDEEDVAMLTALNSQRPPLPADYKWCIVCEEFGHYWNSSSSSECKYFEYERRCPPQFRNQAAASKQPFIPAGVSTSSNKVPYNTTNPTSALKESTIFHSCMFPDCNTKLGPWYIPCPPKGQEIVCHKCHRPNKHPAVPRRDSKVELLDLVLNFMKEQNQNTDVVKKKKTKKQSALDGIKNPYLKRPSMALSKKLAVYQWPETQPQYTDLSTCLNKEPVFKDDGSWFNIPGNHQTYFPAAKFKIRKDMIATAVNDDLAINKAGRLGLKLQCLTCGMPAMVSDDEGDYVMCGTDAMCTVGCGVGAAFWCDETGRPRDRCRCLPIIGQTPNIAWVTQPAI